MLGEPGQVASEAIPERQGRGTMFCLATASEHLPLEAVQAPSCVVVAEAAAGGRIDPALFRSRIALPLHCCSCCQRCHSELHYMHPEGDPCSLRLPAFKLPVNMLYTDMGHPSAL